MDEKYDYTPYQKSFEDPHDPGFTRDCRPLHTLPREPETGQNFQQNAPVFNPNNAQNGATQMHAINQNAAPAYNQNAAPQFNSQQTVGTTRAEIEAGLVQEWREAVNARESFKAANKLRLVQLKKQLADLNAELKRLAYQADHARNKLREYREKP